MFLQIAQCDKGKLSHLSTIPLVNSTLALVQTFCLLKHIEEAELRENSFVTVPSLLKHITNTPSAKSTEEKLSNPDTSFRCFKVARKQQIVKSDSSFHVPFTFIGAIYECFVSSQEKELYLKSLSSEGKSFHKLVCDSVTAVPLSPIVADDASKSSIALRQDPFSVSQILPYLRSASALDPRFSSSKPTHWAKDIKVNEDYTFPERETSKFEAKSSEVSSFVKRVTKAPLMRITRKLSPK